MEAGYHVSAPPIWSLYEAIRTVFFLIAVAALTTTAYRLLNPEWVVFRKAETLFSQNDFEAAIPHYEELLRLDFQAPRVLRHLASAYLATGKEIKARHIFETIMERYGRRPEIMKELAGIYVNHGGFSEAAALYMEILREDPHDHSSRIYLARLLSWTGRFEEAIYEYRKALGEEP